MTLSNEQKAHDLATTILNSEKTNQINELFLALEDGGKIAHDDDYLIRYKKAYDFLYESFLSEFKN